MDADLRRHDFFSTVIIRVVLIFKVLMNPCGFARVLLEAIQLILVCFVFLDCFVARTSLLAVTQRAFIMKH